MQAIIRFIELYTCWNMMKRFVFSTEACERNTKDNLKPHTCIFRGVLQEFYKEMEDSYCCLQRLVLCKNFRGCFEN